MQQALQLSDLLIDEFVSADVYVFGVPMFNFGVPAVFKAYIDNIVRVGRTFLYVPDDAEAPYKPLVHGKRMFVLVSSGAAGYEPVGPMWSLNHLEPYLRTIFGFIGVRDMTFIYAGNDTARGEKLENSINAPPVSI
jgi:FMN-dependent NADH-azoreductase